MEDTMHDPPVEIDAEIRGLTYLISKLSPQASSATPGPKDDRLLLATHIATLATRGNENVRSVASRAVAVVVNYPNVLVWSESAEHVHDLAESLLKADLRTSEFPELPVHAVDSHLRGSRPAGKPFSHRRVLPSQKTLKELAESSDSDLDMTLQDHLADVLAAIAAARNERRHAALWMHLFVHRRCFSKIVRRVHMDKHLFIAMNKTAKTDPIRPTKLPSEEESGEDIRLECVLKLIASEWEDNADPSSIIESRWLHVASPVPGVPSRKINGKMEYEWNVSTARNWIEWLSALLKKIRDASTAQPEGESDQPQKINYDTLRKLTGNLGALSSLVASGQLNDMLNIPPITRVLRRYIRITDDRGDGVGSDEDMQLRAEGREPPLSRITRYLNNLVAWSRAVDFIRSASRRLAPQNLVLNLVEMRSPHPIPADKLPLARLLGLYDALNIPYEPSTGSESAEFQARLGRLCHRLNLDPKDLLHPTTFTGTIHCEAALMGVIASDGTAKKSVTTKDGRCCIGVGKKSCWCCNWLAEMLSSREPAPVKFVLAGTHGIVYPWAPPAGIPLSVWENMRTALNEQLVTAVWSERVTASQTSSPAGSIASLSSSDDDWVNQLAEMQL